MLELSGTAVSIDTDSMVLTLGHEHQPGPELGERVRLELLLPVNSVKAKPKCLTVRARVVRVTEMPDGTRQIGFSFRKPSFRDLPESSLRKPAVATSGWEM